MKKNNLPSLPRTDKLCGLALVGILVLTTACYEVTDGAAIRAAAREADKPPLEIALTVPMGCKAFVLAVEQARYRPDVPLSRELQAALWEACEAHGVPVSLALGLIEVESGFQADLASSAGCIGLMQTNVKYADTFEENTGRSIYAPDGNIYCGVWYLAKLIEQYDGDQLAALTAYNKGSYTGAVSQYAKNVMKASEKWGVG